MEVKRAQVHGQKWVPMTCERCGAYYSCLAEAWGFADTGFLGLTGIVPSDDMMAGAADADMRGKMKEIASHVPCPKCAHYGEEFVDRKRRSAAKAGAWAGFLAAAATAILLAVAVWSTAPAWILFPILALAWVASRFAANYAMNQVDPNRDLAANTTQIRKALAAGKLRIDNPPAKYTTPRTPQA